MTKAKEEEKKKTNKSTAGLCTVVNKTKSLEMVRPWRRRGGLRRREADEESCWVYRDFCLCFSFPFFGFLPEEKEEAEEKEEEEVEEVEEEEDVG